MVHALQVAGKNDFRGHVFGCGHHFFAPWDTLRTKVSSCGICAIINRVEAPLGGCSKTPGKAEEVPPEEDDPDADFAGAPLLAGGDEDEWETWCTEQDDGPKQNV